MSYAAGYIKQLNRWTSVGNIHDFINKKSEIFDLHKGMVNECPGSRSLQDIVEVVLELPVARVSPAALRAVDERFP